MKLKQKNLNINSNFLCYVIAEFNLMRSSNIVILATKSISNYQVELVIAKQ